MTVIIGIDPHKRSHTAVALGIDDEALGELRVAADARQVANPSSSSGFGLIGMRERASLLGGSLWAGPGADRGWVVEAMLPVRDPAADPSPVAERSA